MIKSQISVHYDYFLIQLDAIEIKGTV